jgi:hypothetical protein
VASNTAAIFLALLSLPSNDTTKSVVDVAIVVVVVGGALDGCGGATCDDVMPAGACAAAGSMTLHQSAGQVRPCSGFGSDHLPDFWMNFQDMKCMQCPSVRPANGEPLLLVPSVDAQQL